MLSERATFGKIISLEKKNHCLWLKAHYESNSTQIRASLTTKGSGSLLTMNGAYIFHLLTSCASQISLLLGRQHRQWWIVPDTDGDRMSINKWPYDE